MHKKKLWLVVALIAVLPLAMGAAASQSGVTRFEVTAYVCEIPEPAGQWVSGDGVLHQRGLVLRYDLEVPGEPRLTGPWIDLANQDVDLNTGAIDFWSEGIIATSEGTWYTETTAESIDGVIHSRGSARGEDGLKGQVVSWTGLQVFPSPDQLPCEGGLAVTLTGFIRGRDKPKAINTQ